MALIQCPECGGNVSSNAKVCIHCGNPLVAPDTTLKIKLGGGTRIYNGQTIVTRANLNFVITNDTTGQVLATAHQEEVVSLNLTEPTTIRCHLGKGWKDALLNYIPHENAKYKVDLIDTFFGARLEFHEVDQFH